jgi:tRNA1Val (adenine37-N6)-methyltransferase
MKTRGDFHFKKFSISHDRSTHKVGTDAVLLGAWVNVQGARRILDIGTGSGVIALMLAQRTEPSTIIDAVELQENDALQAESNVQKSPWPNKVVVHHMAIQKFISNAKYNLIVSNPPFFIDSWLPPDHSRSFARHTNSLSFEDLLTSVNRLLDGDGRFAIVLPAVEATTFVGLARKFSLIAIRKMVFKARTEKPAERLLIEFSYLEQEVTMEELVLYEKDEIWSDSYRALTKEFYLKA